MTKQVLMLVLAVAGAYPLDASACQSAIIGKEATADGRVISWWAFQWGWGHRLYVPRADDPVNREAPLGPLQFTSDNNNIGHLLVPGGDSMRGFAESSSSGAVLVSSRPAMTTRSAPPEWVLMSMVRLIVRSPMKVCRF